VIDGTDTLIVFAVGATPTTVESLRQRLAARLKVQQRAIDVRTIAALPRTPAGKVDYPQLRACA
jgi:acyl-CoA synthetase (AMP-forming)/AMP-acid ligase II